MGALYQIEPFPPIDNDTLSTHVYISDYNALCEDFLKYLNRKPTTTKAYKGFLRQFILWAKEKGIDHRPIERDDLISYGEHLKQRNISPATQFQYLRAAKQFLLWASNEGYISKGITDNVRAVKVDHRTHNREPVPIDALIKIDKHLKTRSDEVGRRLFAIVKLVSICGLRTIEVSRANLGDIHLIDGCQYLYIQGKGHDAKDTPKALTHDTARAIQMYLNVRTGDKNPKAPLFTATSNRGRAGTNTGRTGADGKIVISDGRIRPTTISTMLKNLLVEVGYNSPKYTAHSFRHAAADNALKSGLDVRQVQKLMGHQSVQTTEVYLHDRDTKETEVIGRNAIERFIKTGQTITPIIPELRTKLESMTEERQRELLRMIKGGIINV